MKVILTAAGVLALTILIFAFVAVYRPARNEPPAVGPQTVVSRPDDAHSARLSQQVEELERKLSALKSQLSAQRDDGAARAAPVSQDQEPQTVEEQRARDAERLRSYMQRVEQAFANEKVDAAWASATSSRVAATFDGDEVLKGIARTVECRQQTCRVQIEDDGSGKLDRRMPMLALGLADALPSFSADRVEQGNGRSAMVLYMSSQRQGPASGGK